MATRDVVVIGTSAGGVEALKGLVSGLPADFEAAVFVVLHMNPRYETSLPHLLTKSGPLMADLARDGEEIRHGRIYVAPPNRHLLVERGHVHLSAAPKENRARPAINPLFRSAALAYGPRVIAVILSGLLDDGTSGLWEVKRRGGVAVVQQPSDAAHEQMPKSALENVAVDHVVPLEGMGHLLTSLTKGPLQASQEEINSDMEAENIRLTCPECHGPLQRLRFGTLVEFRCRVGHRYSPESALAAHEEAEERLLWSAIETLEEGADLEEEVRGLSPDTAQRSPDKIEVKRKLAKRIRATIEEEL